MDALTISATGGFTYTISDYRVFQYDYFGNLSLDYYFLSLPYGDLGARIFGGMGFTKGKDSRMAKYFDPVPLSFRTRVQYAGGGILYMYYVDEYIAPYLFAGVSYLQHNSNSYYRRNEMNYNIALGFRFNIFEQFGALLDFGGHISPKDHLDNFVTPTTNDLFYTGGTGASWTLAFEKDDDNDGVNNSEDRCPGTLPGLAVDEYGCPLDSDGDGVADHLDSCPETPVNVAVNSKGCPKDSDEDGVPDYMDACKETPLNITVDAKGCPVDSDQDGVADFSDKCPNTPPGVEVDINGCQLRDHVTYRVDELILGAGTTFELNRAILKPAAFGELDKLVDVMKSEPESKWLIEGHTDITGPYKFNKKLSLQRAQAVYNYFVKKGISGSRFEVRGLGPDFPVADNSTREGREKNRRVVIIRTDKRIKPELIEEKKN